MENKKTKKLDLENLENVVGGVTGEPVPGADIFIEQEPDDEPVDNSASGSRGGFAVGGFTPA